MDSYDTGDQTPDGHQVPFPGAIKYAWFSPMLALAAVTLSSAYSYPVFHSLVEGFSVFISFGIFVLAWNTRNYLKEEYLLLLGIIALCNGVVDTCHLMSYKGVALFPGFDSNLPTSLWIASRYLQSVLLAVVSYRLSGQAEAISPPAVRRFFIACAVVTALLVWTTFAGFFPVCFIEGTGQTPFKKGSEVLISLLFAASAALLWRRRSHFEPAVARLLLASVAASLVGELSFIFYLRVFDLSNLAGHLCKVASQYFIYRAIIIKGLRQPLDLLFHQLNTKQGQLTALNDSLEQTVRERTRQLEQDLEERKKVEADLARQTSLLSGLLHSIPDLIFFKDQGGVYLGCNPEFSRFVGRPLGDIVGCSDFDLFPKELARLFRANDRIMMELGEPRHNEEWVNYPDGSAVLLDTVKAPLRALTGETIGVLGVARDVTRVRAHEAEIERLKDLYAALSQVNQVITRVQTTEELFREIPRLLVEFGRFAMVWIGLHDPATGAVTVVSQCGDQSGYLEGIRVFADDRPEGRGPTGTAIREGKSYICNDYFGDPNTGPWLESAGRALWRSAASFPIRARGTVQGALTVYALETGLFGPREVALLEEAALDISFALDNIEREGARAQGEAELRKLSRAVDQSPVSIFITDPDGVIEFVNPKFTQVTGYPAAEALGKKPSILKSGLMAPEVYRDLWSTISSGAVWKGEFLNKHKNGEVFREYGAISPIKNPDGVITHYLATKEDITDQYHLKEQLLQSQKMDAIGQLAGGIAHDFNNILTVIMGYGGILAQQSDLAEADREAVAQINAASEKAAQLTRGLLAFSRKQLLDPKPVDLNDIVRQVEKFLVRVIGEDVKLNLICHKAFLNIKADAGQIEQVLINLAGNARDAMPLGGVLTVETRFAEVTESFVLSQGCGYPGHYAELVVSDTGSGIDEATGKRIFEPFFTTKEAGKGTGLGMSIAQGIVSQHDGFIYFLSQQGVGTSFHVCLPLIEKIGSSDGGKEPAAPLPQGTETILVAEDDEGVRRITESVLVGQGYRVILAQDGLDAVEKFTRNKSSIRLVLMDMIMPGMSGFEAYRAIRSLDGAVKVLFMSGYTSDYIGSRGELDAGAKLVMKPVRHAELIRSVREMLDEQQHAQLPAADPCATGA